METIRECRKCGPKSSSDVAVVPLDDGYAGFMVYCRNCYDVDCGGDPPAFYATSPQAHGRTRGEAIEAWNDLDTD